MSSQNSLISFHIPYTNKEVTSEQLFMASILLVNAGNYIYNLVLGRFLGPSAFSDAAVLITLLLVLSFAAMTFQLVTAKFTVEFNQSISNTFTRKMFIWSLTVGSVIGLLIIYFAVHLKEVFYTNSSTMFILFGCGVPFYFVMSVNRGIYQGKKSFVNLSLTYQSEMLSRLIITLSLIFLFSSFGSATLVATGILCSLIFGLIPLNFKYFPRITRERLSKVQKSQISKFLLLTAFYELTQIVINNSDILMVKAYFEPHEAGLYASLAMIGRVVYFIAWMFVMLLLPTVVALKKEGKETAQVLLKYVLYISGLSLLIVLACLAIPEFIIRLLFGNEYLAIAPLLWKYAVATSLFAVSNIFSYYYLSLDKYFAVLLSGIFGIIQVGLVAFYHTSLEQVVHMQIVAMLCLFIFQLSYFIIDKYRSKKINNLA